MNLSYYINLILKLEGSPRLTKAQALDLDYFDAAILMLDDIKDQSKSRDGKPCYYLIHGVKKTKQEAKMLRKKAFRVLEAICIKRGIDKTKKLEAKYLLTKLESLINQGQNIDASLENLKSINSGTIRKYERMITLFTGGHVKYGFLLGFLFARTNPTYKRSVVSAGEKVGILRQIIDDANDYKNKHHEPLGDLLRSKKRLPELIFFLRSTTQEKDTLSNLLLDPKKNYSKIKKLVLNKKVASIINKRIRDLKIQIRSELNGAPAVYQTAISQILNEYELIPE